MSQAELERWASKSKFADKTTQTAREAIKRAQQVAAEAQAHRDALKEMAKTDRDAVFRELGIDPDEYARARLEQKVREGQMTPAEREAAAKDAENKRLKAELDKRAKADQDQQQQSLVNNLQRRIESELSAAAKRAGIEPGDESFLAIYESFKEAHELGLLPVDPMGLQPHHADRIIEDAVERMNGAQSRLEKAVLAGLKGKPLLNRLGPAVVKAVLEARLEEIRGGQVAPGSAPIPKGAAPAAKPNGYLSPREFDEKMKQRGHG